jgi:hypothetical protein
MVDLVGIEPTTSSMPWNIKRSLLLTVKDLMDGVVAKSRLKRRDLRPNCAQKLNQWAMG